MNKDEIFMRAAIAAGEKARLLSPPNPWVGCVCVKNGIIISEGWTQVPGGDHAEICALRAAGPAAEGSTLYVTLEPCAHYGRTPPCTKAIIEAKVRRVVVALEDPDKQVCGKGLIQLKSAGIETCVGTCSTEAGLSLRPYLYHRRTGSAYCLMKTAMSIDGRVAASDGSSKWITGDEARSDVHLLRAQSQAILIGSGTAIADFPSLTVRHLKEDYTPPIRVLVDRRGRVSCEGPLFDISLGPVNVFTTAASCSMQQRDKWSMHGASVILMDEEWTFETILSYLGSKGIIQVMVEGGPTLQSHLLKKRLCQHIVAYIGSVILGDQALPGFMDLNIKAIDNAIKLSLQGVKKLGDSIRLDYFLT